MTPLLLAAREGNADAVRALLDGGADINQVSGGEKISPLVIAISNGHYELARLLLDRGADPNLATIDGLAALYATEDTEWAEVGWAPNPITVQEKVSYLDLLKALLQHGANVNARLMKTLWFRPTSHNEEWVDKKGATTFWRAAQSSDVAAMRILVAGGADPNLSTGEGVTPLMVAAGLGWGANATRNAPDSWLPTVKYCVELGADVNAKDIYNYTALHGAAYRGDNDVVKFLVEKGARLDVRSKRGQTVTDMANGPMVNAHLPMEHPDTIALLEKLGAPAPEVARGGGPETGQRRGACSRRTCSRRTRNRGTRNRGTCARRTRSRSTRKRARTRRARGTCRRRTCNRGIRARGTCARRARSRSTRKRARTRRARGTYHRRTCHSGIRNRGTCARRARGTCHRGARARTAPHPQPPRLHPPRLHPPNRGTCHRGTRARARARTRTRTRRNRGCHRGARTRRARGTCNRRTRTRRTRTRRAAPAAAPER